MTHNTIFICLLGRLSELSAGHRIVNKGQRNCDNRSWNAFKKNEYVINPNSLKVADNGD